MNTKEIADVIQSLIVQDENPPSEDWSPYDYGRDVAKTVDDYDVSALLREAFRRLPGSLAESFLDGVLEQRQPKSLRDDLFSVLPCAQSPTSAAAIVGILREQCGIDRLNLTLKLAEGLGSADNSRAQNNYAYALLSLLGNRQRSGSGNALALNQHGDDYDAIQDVLVKVPTAKLSKYARDTLEECIIQK